METIIYQGQEITVSLIGEINTRRGEGMDTILRDEAGIYYFRRELHDGEVGFLRAQRTGEDGYRCFLHRINLTAAILWSIEAGGDSPTLRKEAADCLMGVRAGESYADPLPDSYHEIKKARGKQSAVRWVKKVLAGTALPAPAKPRTLNEARVAIGEPRLVEEAAETVTLNLTSKETGRRWDTMEMPQATFDEIERQAKARGHDFATHLVEMVREVVDADEAKEEGHTVTLNLTGNQFGMLRQAAKFDGMDPAKWVFEQLRNVVACYLGDEYGHRERRAWVGWDGFGEKPPKHGGGGFKNTPESELPISAETRAGLERRARKEGTTLRTQFEFMIEQGPGAVLGLSKRITAELDPFHGDLLRAFERRHGVNANAFASAVVAWRLEELYDFGWNGGTDEPEMAAAIRENGLLGEELTPVRMAELCRAAGLDPADYPEVGADDGEDETDGENDTTNADDDFMAGRGRHAGSPDDIALLAAAAPEPVEAPPPPEQLSPTWQYVFAQRAGEARPIRDVLLDLAADWRAKATEARTQGTDLASTKLHTQADLLDQCADALAATLNNGKEADQ